MLRQLEHLPFEDGNRELGFFSLERRRFEGELLEAFQYLNEPTREQDSECPLYKGMQ